MVPEHRELSQPQLRLRQGTTSPKIPQTEALPRTVCMRSDVEQMQSFGWPTNTIDGSSQGASRQCQLSTAALARWTSRKKKSPTNHNAPDRAVAGRRTTNFVVRLAPDARFVTACSAGYLHSLVPTLQVQQTSKAQFSLPSIITKSHRSHSPIHVNDPSRSSSRLRRKMPL